MADWDKLNSKFNAIIDSMSDADWDKWASERLAKKAMRNSEMLLRAKLQQEKILLSNKVGAEIISDKGHSSSINIILNSSFFGLITQNEPEYPNAA